MPQDTLFVCDNAPCHAHLDSLAQTGGITILRLGPYSPMLNPLETIWSKLKSQVKSQMNVPVVHGVGLGEQRLQFLENIVRNSLGCISTNDCVRSAQHTTTFHPLVLSSSDILPGQYCFAFCL